MATSLISRVERPSSAWPNTSPPEVPAENGLDPERDDARTGIRLVLLAVVAFLPAFRCGWVNWDDTQNFLVNPSFQGLSLAHFRWAWTTTLLGVYQPLSWLMLQAEYSLWGFDPRGYHVVSLLWHAANVLMLYLVGVRLLRHALPAMAATDPGTLDRSVGLAVALFAAHPLRAESVAWISAQPYLPATFFALLSVWSYLRAVDGERIRRGWFIAAWITFVVALLFKAVAISVPAVFFILDAYPLRRFDDPARRRSVAFEKLPFLMVSLGFVVVSMLSRAPRPAALGSRLACAAYSVWFYPIKTLVPLNLRALYTAADQARLGDPAYALIAAAVVAVSVATLLTFRRWPAFAAAWWAYLVMLAPNSGLMRVIAAVAADRYSYVSTMALVLLAAGGFCLAAQAWPAGSAKRVAITLGSLACVALLIVASWFQTATWMSPLMLWAHAVEHGAGGFALAQHNLGEAYSEIGKLDDALVHYERAVILRPDLPMSHLNLGITRARLGLLQESLGPLSQAARLDPASAPARHYLGLSLLRLGDLPNAERLLRESIQLDPADADAHNDLGLALLRQRKADAAAREFQEALRFRHGFDEAKKNLSDALSRR
ncbi:MAG: tetratricopeptide repeat protein [Isosphaeraceae bacterium]